MSSKPVPLVLALFLTACGGAAPAPTSGPGGAPPPSALSSDFAADTTSLLDATAREGAVTEVIHGQEVPDPYRALEEDNAFTWEWVAAQNARTEAYLAEHADPHRAERLEQLLSIGYFGNVALGGDRVFFTKREGDAEQAVLYVAAAGEAPHVLVDPNALGERVAIDWMFPSPSGRYLAYGLSQGGDERSTLHVLDVDGGEALGEAIPHTKWVDLSWLHDDSGFYYTRYPLESEPAFDAENEDNYDRNLFFHRLGADYREDALVFTPGRTDFVGAVVSEDDQWVTLTAFHSWSQSDLYLLDRAAESATPRPLVVGESFLVYGSVHDGRLVLFSNEGHPRGRLLTAPLDRAEDRGTWTELVAEGEGTIETFDMAGGRLLVKYVQDISSRLALFASDGTFEGDVPLPTRGSVGTAALAPDGSRLAFTFDSFFYPPTLFALDTGEPVVLDRVAADIDTEAYTLEQTSVPSADGTPINVFLVHRRDMVRDGNQPVLLNGYGGFAHSQMPGFARNVLYWLERGGVYAVANIRGGGEYGEEWHQAGMLHHKLNSFDDFEAVIRWLGSSGLSSPERIAIIGASNGGLLMGAMLTRCPDAFRAAVSSVGLYDMVRFTQFPPAEIWTGEYGDPANADDFEVLYSYSPYHHVVDGTAYPAAFIDTADQDTRVSWRHSTKFAARLQEATTSGHPILFYMLREQGHGAGTGVSDLVNQYVRYYTFIETELGVAE